LLGLSFGFMLFFAIAAMIMSRFVPEFIFTKQLIIHCILLFFLLLGMWFSNRTADKVKDVYISETQNRNGINEMKTAIQNLKNRMNNLSNFPENFIQRIDVLEENLRFISPSENNEAHSLEQQFISTVNDISFTFSDFSMNENAIENSLKKVERIFQNRKAIYSN
jgi:hypothetical protein